MRGNRVNFIENTFCSPWEMPTCSGQEVKELISLQSGGLAAGGCIFHPSCLSLSKGTVMGQQQTHSESKSQDAVHLREWMYGLGSQPSLWLRLSCPETGPRQVRMQRRGRTADPLMRFFHALVVSESQHPQIRWFKKNVIKVLCVSWKWKSLVSFLILSGNQVSGCSTRTMGQSECNN